MIIQHNISSMNANRNLGITTGALAKSTEKLSSGYRINRAGDDAAGLAISEKMRGQIRGLDQASSNSEDAISLVQTAEGALQETQSILQRMRELAVQSANDTNTDDDRTQIQNEIDQLTQEVDRIATTSEYNTKKLLDGSQKGASTYKAGSSVVAGSFTNGYVQLGTIATTNLANSDLVGIDEVLRFSFISDFVVTQGTTLTSSYDAATGGSTLDYSNGASTVSMIKMQSLNGTGTYSAATATTPSGPDVEIAYVSATDVATITIRAAAYSATTSTLNDGTANSDITLTIENASSIKADDVITISLQSMVTTEVSNNGKEALKFQVGANAGQEITFHVNSMKAKDLGIVVTSQSLNAGGTRPGKMGDALRVETQAEASLAIQAFDKAIQKVSTERANMGALQNRLEHTIANLDTSAENLQAAESRIRDVDMADEMTQYSKNNILMQAGQSMLAQANQSTQGVLSLLQG
ncbi:MAG: flagellin [Lachnospiraceae bacterium]|jgi:flagellin|nr:flagellin [Lachnospiraceae bacterium]